MTTVLVIEVRINGSITGHEESRLLHHVGKWNHLIDTARVIGKTTQADPIRDTLTSTQTQPKG